MKKLFFLILLLISANADSMAAERKTTKDIDTDAFTRDTQVSPSGTGNKHVALIWWMPLEFWQATLAKDTKGSETGKAAMLNALSGVSIVAVVQADISSLGAFDYYSRDEIQKHMVVSFTDADGKQVRLRLQDPIGADLQVVLGIMKPILGAAMGNLGNNLNFFVFVDRRTDKQRLLDPYKKGLIAFQLAKRNDEPLSGSIELPLDSLFVPRKCPNGKDANVSWNFCPWDGTPLAN